MTNYINIDCKNNESTERLSITAKRAKSSVIIINFEGVGGRKNNV